MTAWVDALLTIWALMFCAGLGIGALVVWDKHVAPYRRRRADVARARAWRDDAPRPELIGELRVLVADELARRRDRGAQS